MIVPLFLSLFACNTVGFDAVSINPIYGFVDGCGAATVSGHGFGESPDAISATIGDNPITGITFPDANTELPQANELGYMFSGTIPASTDLAVGYQDVTVALGDQTDTITGSGAFYYVACPQNGLLSEVHGGDGIAAGATVSVIGCNLGEDVYVQVVDATNTPVSSPTALTHTCGTGGAEFTAPVVPADGTYFVQLTDATGNVYSGANGDYCAAATDADTSNDYIYGPGLDTAFARDTAYFGGEAYGCYSLTYGSAS